MVQELLSRVLRLKQHIAFLLLLLVSGEVAFSQSVLLPADVVIVSVNSTGDSFDFIPLVNLEEGTTLWFSNGNWNAESLVIEKGDEVEITLMSAIEAGTNIHINQIEDPRVQVNGHLDFVGNGDRIFAYQKDGDITRVIYGIGWGHNDIWNSESEIGSAIPSSISKENNALLQLGNLQNYQYYLRNGASGTPSMLATFVGDAAKWRGRDNIPYSSLGTAFRILRAPVVLFDESVSTIQENESITLNVAIFEHDGSRLTVDVVFNEINSTADSNDVGKFKKHTFNFTGLIGDAVYAVEVPIFDDRVYESTETAFFELQNLSKGELGDFVTHVAFIPDNEIPKIQIAGLSYSGEPDSDFIEIHSNERISADLSGWKLTSRAEIYEFPYGSYISPLQKMKIAHPESNTGAEKASSWLRLNQGVIELKNHDGELVSAFDYRLTPLVEDRISGQEISVADVASLDNVTIAAVSNEGKDNQEQLSSEQIRRSGWYIVNEKQPYSADFERKEFFTWNEESGSFSKVDILNDQNAGQSVLLSYYTEEELKTKPKADSLYEKIKEELLLVSEDWTVILSSTDLDENGVINGPEGFNFVRSSFSEEISVSHLISTLEASLFEGAIYPYIYLWEEDGKGWMGAKKLGIRDQIPANTPFWIRGDSAFEKSEISMQVQSYVEQVETIEERSELDSELKIALETTDHAKSISIFFLDDIEDIRRDVIEPGLESRLHASEDDFLFFGAGSGLNWNSELYLEAIQDQKMIFPLAFEASETGTFKLAIQKFDGLPADWKITLLDEISQKEYELNANWELEFEYQATPENEPEEIKTLYIKKESELADGETEHRFMLIITPPEAQGALDAIPEVVSLHQNYPNPFNPVTTISFSLPEPVPVKLSVFNVVGQPVAVLTEGTLGSGDHEFEWDATGLPSGMYIYQLEVGTKVMTRKMTLVK